MQTLVVQIFELYQFFENVVFSGAVADEFFEVVTFQGGEVLDFEVVVGKDAFNLELMGLSEVDESVFFAYP